MNRTLFIFLVLLLVFISGCITNEANSETLSNVDTSECEKLTDMVRKTECLGNIAVSNQEPLICDRVEDKEYRDYCYDNFIQISFNKGIDVSVCGKIKDMAYKDVCYGWFAIHSKNVSICEKIQNTSIRNNCYSSTS